MSAVAKFNARFFDSLATIEPNVHVHDRLVRRREAAGVELTILAGTAERIDLPDASVDEVIGSLVLLFWPANTGIWGTAAR